MNAKYLRVAALFLGGMSVIAALLPSVAAAGFPDKPINLVVPFAPGGGTDVLARAIGDRLQRSLGVPVVIENKPGAGGTIGADFVAKARPDGYTILMGTNATLALAPGLYKKLRYDPARDFAPIAAVAYGPSILVVNKTLPVTDVSSLVEYLKSHPGELNYGSAGNGSMAHIATSLMTHATGTRAVHIPFKGGAAATMELIAGRLQFMIAGPVEAVSMINAGQVRGLAVTTETQFEGIPTLPTIAAGGVPGYEIVNWFGIFAPANTPAEVTHLLAKQIAGIVADPTIRDTFLKQGVLPQTLVGTAYTDFVRAEIEKWTRKVRELDISAD